MGDWVGGGGCGPGRRRCDVLTWSDYVILLASKPAAVWIPPIACHTSVRPIAPLHA